MARKHRVLNLGAGVQSTAIYLMMLDGDIQPADIAIFADTGDEPKAVYEHVQYLKTLGGPRIITVTAGNLGDNLVAGVNTTGQRFVTIPTFLSRRDDGQNDGIGKRQCTSEYKIQPIEGEIRRRYGELRVRIVEGYRQEYYVIPPGVEVTQVFGLSFDEPKRVNRVRMRYETRGQWFCEFPLFDEFATRQDCEVYLKKRLPGREVPRSACVFCPYRNDDEWIYLQKTDPSGFLRAVEIDEAIRKETSVCTRDMDSAQYLHRSCVPLSQVKFQPGKGDAPRLSFSSMDCDGMCGQ